MNLPSHQAHELPSQANPPHAFEPYTAFAGVEESVEQQLGQASKLQLPERHRAGFVRFLPWVALAFLPLHFAAVLLLVGVTGLATLFGSFSWGSALISVGVLVLDVIALPGLFARTRRGWAFFVYALSLGALGNVLDLSLLGLLLSAALLWLAFQVKYHYR